MSFSGLPATCDYDLTFRLRHFLALHVRPTVFLDSYNSTQYLLHSVINTAEVTDSLEENFIAESITNPNIFVSHQAADHANSIGQDDIKTEPESHTTDDFASDNDNTGWV